MLDPGDRMLLMESLRPPEGFAFDCAVGTTYSLDLHALIVAPLAFTIFEWQDGTGRPTAHPAALLEALRRHAGRVHLFCQAGGIKVPPRYDRLLTFLEQCAIEVQAPDPQGLFHPKMWALRFTSDDKAVRYRVLVLSRNLTFDRSWDTCLSLEGDVGARRTVRRENRGLVDFIGALPTLIVGKRALRPQAAEDLDRIAREIGTVQFTPPEPFKRLAFRPLGIPGHAADPLDQRTDRLLVVSPFIDRTRLRELTQEGHGHVLVSRSESLEEIDEATLGRFSEVLVLHDDADVEAADEDGGSEGSHERALDRQAPLSGLHAKLYVAQAGHSANVWTGSANATTAGRDRHVEMLVELEGGRRLAGIDRLLEGDGKRPGLRTLLSPFVPRSMPTDEDEAMRRQLAQELDSYRLAVAGSGLEAVAREDDAGLWTTALRAPHDCTLSPPDGTIVRCRPLSLPEHVHGQELGGDADHLVSFGPHAFETLTSFYAFTATAKQSGQSLTMTWVLNLPLIGVPDDRRDRTLLSILADDTALLMRLLLLLLQDDEPDAGDVAEGDSFWNMSSTGDDPPLFETLMRALHRSPDRVADVKRLVDDLRAMPNGSEALPKDLDAILTPVLDAHAQLLEARHA